MIPYIAVLILLIVAILFAVYKRVDGFELMGIIVTEKTTLQNLLNYADRYLELNRALKEKIDTGRPFDEKLTEARAKELGMSYSKDEKGRVVYQRPLSRALSAQLELDITALQGIKDGIQREIDGGKIRKNMTLRQFMMKTSPEQVKGNKPLDVSFFNEVITNQVKTSNAREALITKKLGGGKVAGVDATDLYGAVGGVSEAIKSSTVGASELTKTTKPAPAPKGSRFSTQEMEDRIANRVAKQMKDSMLSQRSTEEVYGGMPCPYAPVTTNAVAQGQEFTQAKPSSMPDMSQYIRKDSIPCWNCTLP